MRRTTAFKVLLGVLAGGALILIAGREGRQARSLVATAVVIGLFLALVRWRDRPRQEAMESEARRLGVRFSAEDRFGLLAQSFQLFRSTRRSYGEIGNVLSGSWHDLEVRAFDHSYSVSEDERRLLSCAQIAIPGGWPALVIRPETGLARLADIAVPDIAVESEAFNRAFVVRCHDRAFASAVVDPRMMEWLESLGHRWGFEIDGRWVLGYRDQVQPWEIESVLETVETFIRRIPRVVTSLYPEAIPPRPDVPA
ncbi:MAG TPA: hypothetical protein VFY08_03445 [Actinomycetota bacterium]|nr:hypothetical protein [Actinomycetota bacterium]